VVKHDRKAGIGLPAKPDANACFLAGYRAPARDGIGVRPFSLYDRGLAPGFQSNKNARQNGGRVKNRFRLVAGLRSCALRQDLPGVVRQLLGFGQQVERRHHLGIGLRPHPQSFFLAEL
jgi:hypothetical protein